MARPNNGPRLVWLAERKRYYIRWYENGRKFQKSTHSQNREKAETALANFIIRLRSLNKNTHPSDLLIEDALTYYYEEHGIGCVSSERVRYCISKLNAFWAGKTVSDIDQRSCREYIRRRQESRPNGIKLGTVRRELGTLIAALNFCVRDGKLAQSVFIALPEKSEPKERWLTVREASCLLWEARKGGRNTRTYLPLFILFGLYTGARSEAILSLTWDRVDLKSHRINFHINGRRRTKKRRPKVPIPRQLLTFLKLAKLRQPASFASRADGGPVIHNIGEPMLRVIRGFKGAAGRAGLADVSPHTLRHTFGTWMAQQGTPLWHISGWLGQDAEITERMYAHHHPDFMEVAKRGAERTNYRSKR